MSLKTFNESGSIDWEFILDSVNREKCILFLGPELLKDSKGRKLDDGICEFLEATDPTNPYIRKYYPDDNFFLFREPRFKRRIISKIRQFYNKEFSTAATVLEKIAKIPFRIIVQLTPDNLLARTFDELHLSYQKDHFSKIRTSVNFTQPTSKRPLLFNLLGNIEEDESLILTHNDLFDYFHSIFMPKSLHQDFKEELESASSFLFIGLQFEKWYMQLLLRILSLHTDKTKELDRFALRHSMNIQVQSFYQEQFGIEFIAQDSTAFVEELFLRCDGAGILKKPQSSASLIRKGEMPGLADIKSMIGSGKSKEAAESLTTFLKWNEIRDDGILDDLLLLTGRIELLQQKRVMGIIDERDATLEDQKILYALIEYTNRAKVA